MRIVLSKLPSCPDCTVHHNRMQQVYSSWKLGNPPYPLPFPPRKRRERVIWHNLLARFSPAIYRRDRVARSDLRLLVGGFFLDSRIVADELLPVAVHPVVGDAIIDTNIAVVALNQIVTNHASPFVA